MEPDGQLELRLATWEILHLEPYLEDFGSRHMIILSVSLSALPGWPVLSAYRILESALLSAVFWIQRIAGNIWQKALMKKTRRQLLQVFSVMRPESYDVAMG